MATLDFKTLKTKYSGFGVPTAVIEINEKKLPNSKLEYQISDIDIELSCGFEASIASFSIYNVYNTVTAQFETDDLMKYIYLGSKVEIYLGYELTATSVFVGLISKVSYQFAAGDIPCIRVTAMDVKSIMMAGNYSRQLKALTFTEAVRELLNKSVYTNLQAKGIIRSVNITQPVLSATSVAGMSKDETIEMVAESDYEFIVKLAKKYNYEFFCDCGNVYFRKAKEVTMPLFTLTPSMGIQSFDIEYDITGLAETIYARSTDAGKGELIQAKSKFSNKISLGNKAKAMIKGSEKVYIDPTISSKEDAQNRVDSLMEEMSFRYGTLNCDMIGLPEMKPGYFLDLQCLGTGPSNVFYITSVRHILRGDGGFTTQITGKSNAMM